MPTLLCIGYGYCARRYVAEFGARFDRIVGTSRSADKHAGPPVEMLAFDGATASPDLRQAIAGADHLLISTAPGEAGDPVLAVLRDDIATAKPESIVYLSSLGVYGDHGGASIDEDTPTVPAHGRGASRVDAERAWQALGRECGTPVAILRLGGIYGPGQNAFVRLRAGRAHRIAKPGHVSNRIHVADIAQAIDAAFARRYDGTVNVTDGEPASPSEQIAYAAQLLGIEPPPEISLEQARRTLSPFILSFYAGCARVRNERLRRELGVTLRYPDYRRGLEALLEIERGAPGNGPAARLT
jgi:nucleoside-diphosphate-sugar epimerase